MCKNPPDDPLGVTGYEIIGSWSTSDENDLIDNIAKIGPIAVGVCATENFQSYVGNGIFDDPTFDQSKCDLNHLVLVVGYTKDYYIIKNSWGEYWGDKGYMKLARNRNGLIGIGRFGIYPKININKGNVYIPEYDYFNSDLLITVWIKTNATKEWATVLNFGNDFDNIVFSLNNLHPRFAMWQGSNELEYITSKKIKLGLWHHVAITLKGDTIKLFINGIEKGKVSKKTFLLLSRPNKPIIHTQIGYSNWAMRDTSFSGEIDGLEIFNHEIKYSQNLNSNYDSGLFGICYSSCDNLLLYLYTRNNPKSRVQIDETNIDG